MRERHPRYLHQGVTLQELDPESDDLIHAAENKHRSNVIKNSFVVVY